MGSASPRPDRPGGRVARSWLRERLVVGDLDAIAEWAGERPAVIAALIPLTYDRDPEVGYRAVEAMGAAAGVVAAADPDAVREVLRRLNWLITEESGGICWHAPEAMAEIARLGPEPFAPYIRIVVHMIAELAEEDLEHFRPGVLRAIGRLGPLAAAELEGVLPQVVSALSHPNPQARGMAVWALVESGRAEEVAGRPELLEDRAPVDLYEGGFLCQTTVAELARRAP